MDGHFKFIYDKQQIDRFQELVYTPESFNNGLAVHQICIAARKKYGTVNIKGSAQHFNHLIINSSGSLYQYIRRYESPLDSYLDSDMKPYNNNVLSIYSTLSSRCTQLVMEGMYQKYVESLRLATVNKSDVKFNFKTEMKSQMSKKVLINRYSKIFVQIDIDSKITEKVMNVVGWLISAHINVYFTIETRCGYHIIIDKRTVPYKYQEENSKISFDKVELLKAESLLTIPGTLQGGFPVRFADEITDMINNWGVPEHSIKKKVVNGIELDIFPNSTNDTKEVMKSKMSGWDDVVLKEEFGIDTDETNDGENNMSSDKSEGDNSNIITKRHSIEDRAKCMARTAYILRERGCYEKHKSDDS